MTSGVIFNVSYFSKNGLEFFFPFLLSLAHYVSKREREWLNILSGFTISKFPDFVEPLSVD